jgi:Fur family ferric uptake transcriptional regulator
MLEINLTTAIEQLLEEKHLLSANEILAVFNSHGHTYNKTSVYRALEQLQKEEKICEHVFSRKEAVYELRDHHHDHLVCQDCGKVEAVECSFNHPKNIKGFKVDHHHTSLFGVCGNCQMSN